MQWRKIVKSQNNFSPSHICQHPKINKNLPQNNFVYYEKLVCDREKKFFFFFFNSATKNK